MTILLDAMGGDNAPDAVIKGTVKAINEIKSDILLIGNEKLINERVKEIFNKESINKISERIKIYNTKTARSLLLRILLFFNSYPLGCAFEYTSRILL